MPNLNTTIDNIELKSNKVTSISDPNTWTDAQYPSARVLLDIAHPIGSILTTATNESPASTLGGTWVPVDRAFSTNYIQLAASYWTAEAAAIEEFSNVLLADHTIAIRLNLRTTTELNDENIVLGKLALAPCGLSELVYTVMYIPVISDLGNCTLSVKIQQDGTISTHDVLNVNGTHKMPSGTDFFINIVLPVSANKMIDTFCDKFYWKRTA